MENYSKQKSEIMEVIKDLPNHPTAEQIYFFAKQKDSAISRSTVYRNLKRFVSKGEIAQITMPNGPARFEYLIDGQKHGYMICEKCEEITNFYYDLADLKKAITEQTNGKMVNNEVIVKGLCQSCLKLQNIN